MTIAYHLQKVFQRIEQAANQSSYLSHPVTLLAVSKTHTSTKIREAFIAGQRDFGESYVQEAIEKIAELDDCNICWHYIGPVQSNKTAKIAKYFDWVQSVDRLKIAQRLSDQRPENLNPLNICLQVNISAEQNKSGLMPEQLVGLMELIKPMTGLKLRGLMCIPAKTANVELQREAFHQMYLLFNKLKLLYPEMDTLSMGMSGDLEAAIAEGSSMVRVGTDIFGARTDSHDSRKNTTE